MHGKLYSLLLHQLAAFYTFLLVFEIVLPKNLKTFLEKLLKKMWDCYNAETKASFSQKIRRLNEWCQINTTIPEIITDKIKKSHNNLSSFSSAYDFSGSHRTSNMIDHLMQRMDRFLI